MANDSVPHIAESRAQGDTNQLLASIFVPRPGEVFYRLQSLGGIRSVPCWAKVIR
jgi:hypothetical protein